MNRRSLLTWSVAGAGAALAGAPVAVADAEAAPVSAFGIDAAELGLQPGNPNDQTAALQIAINKAASARVPLALPRGVYRVGQLKLTSGAHLVGVRGATKLQFSKGASLMSAIGGSNVTLSGLVFDGGDVDLAARRGLVQFDQTTGIRVTDCQFINAGGIALLLNSVEGEITGNTISEAADTALLSNNARGLMIARNTIRGAGNNGILIWRRENGDDGTIIVDNRIENIKNVSGGSGQYGNAVNVFHADNVIVRGNQIRNCAFTAVRGNAAHNIQIANNNVRDMGEVAFYSEFGFEGAQIANNIVDGAAIGVSVCNFNEGGRLAVISGNIIRNLKLTRPAGTDPGDAAGVGIYAEADTTITGNVIENAPFSGISLGFGPYLRDVSATGNIVRKAAAGITVSVSTGAGGAVISHNVITGATRGAIVGMDHRKQATGDLALGGIDRYAHLTATGNRVS